MSDDSDGVVIKISGDPADFQKAAEQVKAILGQIGDSGKSSIGIADIAYGEFIGHLAEKGVELAVEAIGEAFHQVVDFIKQSIDAAEVFEDSFNKLAFSLATAGKYSAESSEDFLKFANSMQEATTVSRNLIASSASTLESLTGLSEQGLERATKAGLDFAAATGKSLPEAMNLIARAAEGNTTALQRAGVTVEATGNKAKDLENVLGALEGRFSGASAAAAQTFSGQVTGVKNSFEDFEATIGSFITKNPAVLAALKGVGDFFHNLTDDLDNNKAAINSFISGGIQRLVDSIVPAANVFNIFLTVIDDLGIAFRRVEQSIDIVVVGTAKIAGVIDGAVAAFERLTFAGDQAAKKRKEQDDAAADSFAESFANHQKEIEATKDSASKREQIINDFSQKFHDSVQTRIDEVRESETQQTEALKEGISARRQASDQAAAETKAAFQSQENTTLNETIRIAGVDKAITLQLEVDKLAAQGKYVEAKKKLTEQDRKNEENDIFAIQKFEELSQKQRFANLQNSLGSIATLQSSSDQTLFSIGKGAALATATIDGIQAVQKALASAPPPFNFAIAALVGVAQAENLSKIAGASPPTGAADGALVTGGTGPNSDDQPFMLAKGELVAPAKNFDEVVSGVAAQRGLTANGGDGDMEQTNQLLQQIIDKLPVVQVVVQTADGPALLKDQLFINQLTKEIREAVQFRGAKLGA